MHLIHRLALPILILCCANAVNAQIIGGNEPGEMTPRAASPATITDGLIDGDVNLFTGSLGTSVDLGSVSTPGGLSFNLKMNYQASIQGGNNNGTSSGIPYGDGWSLNIPKITVSTDAYMSYTSGNYCQYKSGYGVGQDYTVPWNFHDAKPYWYAPMLNIPGVISGRLIFKREEYGGKKIFTLASFENYAEVHFTNTSWKVLLSDGSVYVFGISKKAFRNPSNSRTINYGSQSTDYEEDDSLSILNIGRNSTNWLPNGEVLEWYCTKYYNRNIPFFQNIYFEYEKFGGFNFFQESSKEYQYAIARGLVDATVLGLTGVGSQGATFRHTNVPGIEALTTYQDVLLKGIKAIDISGTSEELVMEHQTYQAPLPALLLKKGASGVKEKDSLYLYKSIFYQGQFTASSGSQYEVGKTYKPDANSTSNFSNWKRLKHITNTSSGLPAPNSLNPYSTGSNGQEKLYAEPVPPSSSISFEHGVLHSGKIGFDQADFYEVRTVIGGSAQFCNFDISITTGIDGGNSIPPNWNYMNGMGMYNEKFNEPIFSTFHNPIKWNSRGRAWPTNKLGVTTSNFFSAPALKPGRTGIYIQVGPASSDMDAATSRLDVRNSSGNDQASLAYWYKSSTTIGGRRERDRVPQNFGLGTPWYEARRVYKYAAPGYDYSITGPIYDFWRGDVVFSQSSDNKPTLVDTTLDLRAVELIKYVKNPWMLKHVKKYRYVGKADPYQSNSGKLLVGHKYLKHKWQQLPNFAYTNTSQLNASTTKTAGHKVYFLLSSISDLSVDGFNSLSSSNPNQNNFTQFDYEAYFKDETDPNTAIHHKGEFLSNGFVLTKIINKLGGKTYYEYTPPNHPSNFASKAHSFDYGLCITGKEHKNSGSFSYLPTIRKVKKEDNGGKVRTWDYFYWDSTATCYTDNGVSTFNKYDNFNGFFNYGNIEAGNDIEYHMMNRYHDAQDILTTQFTNRLSPDKIGFRNVIVLEPKLDDGTRQKKVHHFYTDELPNGAVWGKLKYKEQFDGNGNLILLDSIIYDTIHAFENAIHRPDNGRWDHYDYHEYRLPPLPNGPNSAVLSEVGTSMYTMANGQFPSAKFYETSVMIDDKANAEPPTREYLQSFFVKKVKSIHREYDPNGCVKLFDGYSNGPPISSPVGPTMNMGDPDVDIIMDDRELGEYEKAGMLIDGMNVSQEAWSVILDPNHGLSGEFYSTLLGGITETQEYIFDEIYNRGYYDENNVLIKHRLDYDLETDFYKSHADGISADLLAAIINDQQNPNYFYSEDLRDIIIARSTVDQNILGALIQEPINLDPSDRFLVFVGAKELSEITQKQLIVEIDNGFLSEVEVSRILIKQPKAISPDVVDDLIASTGMSASVLESILITLPYALEPNQIVAMGDRGDNVDTSPNSPLQMAQSGHPTYLQYLNNYTPPTPSFQLGIKLFIDDNLIAQIATAPTSAEAVTLITDSSPLPDTAIFTLLNNFSVAETQMDLVLAAQSQISDYVLIRLLQEVSFSNTWKVQLLSSISRPLSTPVLYTFINLAGMDSEDGVAQIFLKQSHLHEAIIKELCINNPILASSDLESVLLKQPPLDDAELTDVLQSSIGVSGNTIETISLKGDYPSESNLNLIISHPQTDQSNVTNILLGTPTQLSSSLIDFAINNGKLVESIGNTLGNFMNFSSAGIPPQGQLHCNLNGVNQVMIETISDYEYFDAHYNGTTTANGHRAITGNSGDTAFRLLYEPSWQLFSKHTYTPQDSGRENKDYYYYYYDLKNRYNPDGDNANGELWLDSNNFKTIYYSVYRSIFVKLDSSRYIFEGSTVTYIDAQGKKVYTRLNTNHVTDTTDSAYVYIEEINNGMYVIPKVLPDFYDDANKLYAAPKLGGIINSRKNHLRNIVMQHTNLTRRPQDNKFYERNKYYHYDSRWNVINDVPIIRVDTTMWGFCQYGGGALPPIDCDSIPDDYNVHSVDSMALDTMACLGCEFIPKSYDNVIRYAGRYMKMTDIPFGKALYIQRHINLQGDTTGGRLFLCDQDTRKANDITWSLIYSSPYDKDGNPVGGVSIASGLNRPGANTFGTSINTHFTTFPGMPTDSSEQTDLDTANLADHIGIFEAKPLDQVLLYRATYTQLDTIRDWEYDYKSHFSNYAYPELVEWVKDSYDILSRPVYNPKFPHYVQKNHEVLERDYYARPALEEDEGGIQTRYYFDKYKSYFYIDTNNRCKNFSARDRKGSGRINRVTVGFGRHDSLVTTFDYYDNDQIYKIHSPNGSSQSMGYDSLGRLATTGRDGSVLSEIKYHTWRGDSTKTWEQRAAENYVETTTYNHATNGNKTVSRAWFDPMGRDYNTATYDLNGGSTNIVAMAHSGLVKRDAMGRVIKNYKPFLISNTTLSTTSITVNPRLWSTTDSLTYPNAFAETKYFNDPRGLTDKTAAFGETINGHTVQHDYQIVNAVCAGCEMGLDHTQMPQLFLSNYDNVYLKRKAITDEDNKTHVTFENVFGQKIAEYQNIDNSTKAVTLYFYDKYGNLNKVINPKGQTTSYYHNMLGWIYKKTTIDGGTTKYMYGKRGQVVLEQDANAGAEREIANKWYRAYKYDAYGKMVMQQRLEPQDILPGISYSNHHPISQMTIDPLAYKDWQHGIPTPIFATASLPQNLCKTKYKNSGISSLNWLAEARYDKNCSGNVNPLWYPGFITAGIPLQPDYNPVEMKYVILNMTDTLEKEWKYDYDRTTSNTNKLAGQLAYAASYDHSNPSLPVQHTWFTYHANGNLKTEKKKFNPSGVATTGSGFVTKISYPDYDLQNNLVTQNIDVHNDGVLDMQYHWRYNTRGQLTHSYANYADVKSAGNLLTSYSYDLVHQRPITKRLHTPDYSLTNFNTTPDAVSYTYDLRDRLTDITSNHYKQELRYDGNTIEPTYGSTANYNGNINEIRHTYTGILNNSNTVYDYVYDGLNRMTEGRAKISNLYNGGNAMQSQIGYAYYDYDKIGNIIGKKLMVDELGTAKTHSWNINYVSGTNKMLTAAKLTNDVFSVDYTYDASGNTTSRDYAGAGTSGMAFIERNWEYGRANLPYHSYYNSQAGADAIFDYSYDENDKLINQHGRGNHAYGAYNRYYLYDFYGRNIAQFHSDTTNQQGVAVKYFAYTGERSSVIVPASNQRTTINFSSADNNGAYSTFTNAQLSDMQHYIYDHLGNARVMTGDDNASATSVNYVPRAAYDYSPYGTTLRQQDNQTQDYRTTKHLRNSLEGVDYRYARNSDYLTVPVFLSMDPLADKFPSMSPYSYVGGNPVSFIDPDGMQLDHYQINGEGEIDMIEKTDDDFDILFNEDKSKSVKVNDQSILPQLDKDNQKISTEGYGMYTASTTNRAEAFKVFLFAANNSNVEWSIHGYGNGAQTSDYVLGTFNKDFASPGTSSLGASLSMEKFEIHSHSRRDGNPGPNGGDLDYYNRKAKGGTLNYHGLYDKENQSLYNFNGSSSSFIRKVGTNSSRFNFGAF